MRNERNRQVTNFRMPANARVGGAGPVSVTFRQSAKGLAEVSLGLDYSKASPPDLSYVADHVVVKTGRSGFVLKFGKLSADETTLRTRIEIIFPKSMFQNQLIRSSRNFLTEMPTVEEVEPLKDEAFADPEKTQTFKANNVMLAAWGDEGVADFYYVSPGDFAFAARNQLSDIRLIPSIRVTMSIQLLREFLEQCHGFDTRVDLAETVPGEKENV